MKNSCTSVLLILVAVIQGLQPVVGCEVDFYLWDATADIEVDRIQNGSPSFCIMNGQFAIEARPTDECDSLGYTSVQVTTEGPEAFRDTSRREQFAPYVSFGDKNPDIKGRDMVEGFYTVSVSLDGSSEEEIAADVVSFEFVECDDNIDDSTSAVEEGDCTIDFLFWDATNNLEVGAIHTLDPVPFCMDDEMEFAIEARPTPACDSLGFEYVQISVMGPDGFEDISRREGKSPYVSFGDQKSVVKGREMVEGDYIVSASLDLQDGTSEVASGSQVFMIFDCSAARDALYSTEGVAEYCQEAQRIVGGTSESSVNVIHDEFQSFVSADASPYQDTGEDLPLTTHQYTLMEPYSDEDDSANYTAVVSCKLKDYKDIRTFVDPNNTNGTDCQSVIDVTIERILEVLTRRESILVENLGYEIAVLPDVDAAADWIENYPPSTACVDGTDNTLFFVGYSLAVDHSVYPWSLPSPEPTGFGPEKSGIQYCHFPGPEYIRDVLIGTLEVPACGEDDEAIDNLVNVTEAPTEATDDDQVVESTEAPIETAEPTVEADDPTEVPTETPAADPTEAPTEAPVADPTEAPTETPVADPTEMPTESTVAPEVCIEETEECVPLGTACCEEGSVCLSIVDVGSLSATFECGPANAVCEVCGADKTMGAPDADPGIPVTGLDFTCGDLEQIGIEGSISAFDCPLVATLLVPCECQ